MLNKIRFLSISLAVGIVLSVVSCNQNNNSNTSEITHKPSSSYLQNVEYTYYSDGSCKPSDRIICMNEQEYKEICLLSVGVTKGALMVAEMNYPGIRGKHSSREIYVKWTQLVGSNEYACYATYPLDDDVFGGISWQANKFIKNSDNKILVHNG